MTHNRGPNWQSIRRERIERDNCECAVCGWSEDDLELAGEEPRRQLVVHHKLPVRVFETHFDDIPWEVVNHVENLVTLCDQCHYVVENADGYLNYIEVHDNHAQKVADLLVKDLETAAERAAERGAERAVERVISEHR